MTIKELEKEAEEYAKKLEENQTVGVYDRDEDLEYDKGWNAGEVSGYEDGYIAGAESREKRIAELEAQIEKMKSPHNCKNGSVYNWSDNSICMDCEKVRTLYKGNWQEKCKGCKYWELRK